MGAVWCEWVVSEGRSRLVKWELVCGKGGSRLVWKVGVGWYGRWEWVGMKGGSGLVWKVGVGWWGRWEWVGREDRSGLMGVSW